MGRWDCPSCGHTNLGPDKHCAACGKSRGNQVKFYLPENEPAVTDASQIAEAKAGPDWECAHCGGANRARSNFCTDCGAEKGTSPSREVKTYGLGEAVANSSPSSSVLAGDHKSPITESSGMLKPLAMLGVIGAVILGIYLIFFQTHEVKVSISGFSWTRTVHIEEYRTVREGDWSIPAGGRQISTESRIHHYVQVFDHNETRTRQVFDHTEEYNCGSRDNGNGYFEDVTCSRSVYRDETYQEAVYRSDPVYQPWYNYDIDKWVHSRDAVASGTTRDDPAPSWPAFTLAHQGETVLGAERESGREDHYTVTFADAEGKTYTREEDTADWLAYDTSQEYILVLTNLGIVTNDPLRPEEK